MNRRETIVIMELKSFKSIIEHTRAVCLLLPLVAIRRIRRAMFLLFVFALLVKKGGVLCSDWSKVFEFASKHWLGHKGSYSYPVNALFASLTVISIECGTLFCVPSRGTMATGLPLPRRWYWILFWWLFPCMDWEIGATNLHKCEYLSFFDLRSVIFDNIIFAAFKLRSILIFTMRVWVLRSFYFIGRKLVTV